MDNVDNTQTVEPQPKTEGDVALEMLKKAVESGYKLPEQFKTPEDFVKSFKELQGHSTRQSEEIKTLKTEEQQKQTEPTNKSAVNDMASAILPDKSKELVGEDGIDWSAIDAELMDTTELSEATKASLKEAGIPDSFIEAKVRDHKNRMKDDAAQAAVVVGGEEQLKELLEWAKSNLLPDDTKVVADQLRGPGWKLALMGLQTLRAQDTSNPSVGEPKTEIEGTVQPSGNAAPRVPTFTSNEEMTAAIRDPRYKVDKEYREEVYRKIRESGMIKHVTAGRIQSM